MTYNRTITKAAEIISVALVGAGIAADGWAMQIISAAPVAADADRYTVAVYQPRHRIPSTVWALTIDTAHDGWTIAARTMECTYNRDTTGAEYAPRHALASAMTGRIRITAPDAYAMHLAELGIAETPDTTETTETTETAPAAEPETETAETEQAEHDARIADILGAVRCEIVAGYYRRKQRVTAKCIREAERAGAPTVRVGYCGAQWLLSYLTPAYYTAGVYGWNCDVYTIAGLTICTGYRGMVGEPAVLTADYERRARAAAGEDERNAILAEWIAANLDAIQTAREGVRA